MTNAIQAKYSKTEGNAMNQHGALCKEMQESRKTMQRSSHFSVSPPRGIELRNPPTCIERWWTILPGSLLIIVITPRGLWMSQSFKNAVVGWQAVVGVPPRSCKYPGVEWWWPAGPGLAWAPEGWGRIQWPTGVRYDFSLYVLRLTISTCIYWVLFSEVLCDMSGMSSLPQTVFCTVSYVTWFRYLYKLGGFL